MYVSLTLTRSASAREPGEAACKYINSKIHTSGETRKRLIAKISNVHIWDNGNPQSVGNA